MPKPVPSPSVSSKNPLCTAPQTAEPFCKNTFPDSFRDESENYFSFRADGVLCYVSNFHSVSGGMVILISAV